MSECFVMLGIMAQYYQTTSPIIPGSNYAEVRRKALIYYSSIEKQTKRRPYIRSVYFKKQKIFFDYFWIHLAQKSANKEKMRRLKLLAAGVELIKYSPHIFSVEENRNKRSEMLYRFLGKTCTGQLFFAQVKENTKTGHKYLMSIFLKE